MSSTDLPNRERLDEVFRGDAYMSELGMQLVRWTGGTAMVRWTPRDVHRNFSGMVHGGAIFSLADAAFAIASNSWGRVCVALTVEIQYLSAPPVGVELEAVSRERSRSRRAASYLIEVRPTGGDIEVRPAGGDIEVRPTGGDIEVRPPASEDLVASFHAMVHRTDRWHLGEDAWSVDWRAAH